jgi:hypothetical protein
MLEVENLLEAYSMMVDGTLAILAGGCWMCAVCYLDMTVL